MRAVRQTKGGVALVDVPEPHASGPVVAVAASGICGSDLHLLALGPFPFTPGHEFSGRLANGSLVAVDPSGPCGTCDQCRAGAAHRCRTGAERAIGVGADGGMTERVAVPDAALVRLPPDLDVTEGCLVEPLGVALHGVRLAGVETGMRVAVVGGGTIGLAAVAAAVDAGADVGLVARHPHQQAAGERLGAAVAAEGEFDVVVEAAGTEAALATAAERCRPGGLVLFVSTHWAPVAIPGIPALMKELAFRWSYTYGEHGGRRDLDDAAALLARNDDIAATLITHRFPLAEAPAAFAVAADRAAGAIKVVLEP